MSAADEARQDMLARVMQAYAPVMNAGRVVAKLMLSAQSALDLEDAMRGVVDLIVAGEQLGENVKAFTEGCRNALGVCFDDTGCPEVSTMHHKAAMARKPAFVSIDGEPQFEDDRFWNAPTPNKKALKDALEAGEDVPGCTLIRPNALSLRITTRK